MTLNVSNIFVIHYKLLKDRKEYIEDYFNKKNITNYIFCQDYQREELTEELKNKYTYVKNLSPAQICITIEHIEVYKKIIENNISGWCLILEDDALFTNNFIYDLNEILDIIPNDADYIDICTELIDKTQTNTIYKTPITKTCCSYLIKKETCEKILETIIPFEFAIDHELNKQIKIHNLNVYHSRKGLVNHGSCKKYSSSYVYY
tara:strand:- start:73 stop:687 length:615 start_codon:yes stop_codon:yes gene_type:complete